MFNFGSPTFRKLGLDREKLTEDELIDLMLDEPRLVRRPVVRIDEATYFGAGIGLLSKIVQ
jgi:arsenate reductase-like glutaredoxin family protein